MRDDYLQKALLVISDPNILVNVISRRVKQLRGGSRALVESLEKLSSEDLALREVAEGKITYELAPREVLISHSVNSQRRGFVPMPGKAKAESRAGI